MHQDRQPEIAEVSFVHPGLGLDTELIYQTMFLTPLDNSHKTSRVLKVALVAAVFLAGFLAGQNHFNDVATKLVASEYERSVLATKNREMSLEISTLVQQRYSDEATIEDLQSAVTEVRKTRSREIEELKLYRNLSRGGENNTGIAISPLEISELTAGANTEEGTSQYRLALTLTQPRGRQRVNGELALQIVGNLASGERLELPVDKLLPDQVPGEASTPASEGLGGLGGVNGEYPLFDFRYFQRFLVDVDLPAGFIPEGVIITATPENPYRSSIRQISTIAPWQNTSTIRLVNSNY